MAEALVIGVGMVGLPVVGVLVLVVLMAARVRARTEAAPQRRPVGDGATVADMAKRHLAARS